MNWRHLVTAVSISYACIAGAASAQVATITTITTGTVSGQGVPGIFPALPGTVPFELTLTASFDNRSTFSFPDLTTIGTNSAGAAATLTVNGNTYHFSSDSAQWHVQILTHEGGAVTLRNELRFPLPGDRLLTLSSSIHQAAGPSRILTVPELFARGSGSLALTSGTAFFINSGQGNQDSFLTMGQIDAMNFSTTGTPLPVPEPSTYAMLLAGLGLLSWMRHRQAAAPRIQGL